MHGDGYKTVSGSWLICDSSDQTTIKDKYQKVWQQIATKFQSYSEHLIFESMNEEFDGQYGTPTQPCYSNINAYNQIFVDTVRQTGGNNSSRWLLVPGWNTNIDYTVGNYGFALPTDQYRSLLHPQRRTADHDLRSLLRPVGLHRGGKHATSRNGGRARPTRRRSRPGDSKTIMDAQLKKMHDTFVARGYPVFVGEYGAIDKTSPDSSNNKYRADFARTLVAAAKKYGAATAYWDNGYNGQYGFGLFNRSSATVTQQGIIDAIMSAVGGTASSSGASSSSSSSSSSPSSPSSSASSSSSSASQASGACQVTDTISAWNTGLTSNITITNTGTAAINGWSLVFTLPSGQTITSGWNATYQPYQRAGDRQERQLQRPHPGRRLHLHRLPGQPHRQHRQSDLVHPQRRCLHALLTRP